MRTSDPPQPRVLAQLGSRQQDASPCRPDLPAAASARVEHHGSRLTWVWSRE